MKKKMDGRIYDEVVVNRVIILWKFARTTTFIPLNIYLVDIVCGQSEKASNTFKHNILIRQQLQNTNFKQMIEIEEKNCAGYKE